MTVRMDKFKVGDSVTWFDDEYANLSGGRSTYGNGPFTIKEVFDRAEFELSPDESFWESMGHTQHVRISGAIHNDIPETSMYSGAFFKKVD